MLRGIVATVIVIPPWGSGSTFTVRLPLEYVREATQSGEIRDAQRLRSTKGSSVSEELLVEQSESSRGVTWRHMNVHHVDALV